MFCCVTQQWHSSSSSSSSSSNAMFFKLWSADHRCSGSPGGPRRSAVGFGRKKHCKIVSESWRMKNTPIHVCAKTAFVGWPSTESRRISYFHNLLSYNHYFRKYFKLLYRKCVYGNFDPSIMLLLFTCMHLWVWESLRRWFACAPAACEVHDCRKFEKHCISVCLI
jgi:hypothetical protein